MTVLEPLSPHELGYIQINNIQLSSYVSLKTTLDGFQCHDVVRLSFQKLNQGWHGQVTLDISCVFLTVINHLKAKAIRQLPDSRAGPKGSAETLLTLWKCRL